MDPKRAEATGMGGAKKQICVERLIGTIKATPGGGFLAETSKFGFYGRDPLSLDLISLVIPGPGRHCYTDRIKRIGS